MASWSIFVYLFQLVHAGVRCWISLRSGNVSLHIWCTVVKYSANSHVCIFYKSYMLIWNSNFLTFHIVFCLSVFLSTHTWMVVIFLTLSVVETWTVRGIVHVQCYAFYLSKRYCPHWLGKFWDSEYFFSYHCCHCHCHHSHHQNWQNELMTCVSSISHSFVVSLTSYITSVFFKLNVY